MSEDDARLIAKETLERLGSHKGWHKILIRFGTNTVKDFEDPSERDIRLRDGDIFFIDIGPIWGDAEGDGGETFVIGQNPDPDMHRCAEDVKRIFDAVRDQWMASRMTGKELYDFAEKKTAELGWVLNIGLTGHRLSESPTVPTMMARLPGSLFAPHRIYGSLKFRFVIRRNHSGVSSKTCSSPPISKVVRSDGERQAEELAFMQPGELQT